MGVPPATVYLVGAGPGDPGLLTVRAAELLARADFVVYDQLVSRRLLAGVNPAAERRGVRDLPGHATDRSPPLLLKMVESARAGRIVVRLKAGDPLTFGRGAEELAALRKTGATVEVVPGVTAALACAAYLELPAAVRGPTGTDSALALVPGHDPNFDWAALARFPGTLAVYMGVSRLPLIVTELLRHGRSADTPAAVVERASTGEMRSTFAPLGLLDDARRQAGLEAPGLVLIGPGAARRIGSSWFESRPLFGQRVLVLRPTGQSEPLLRELETLGAVAVHLPTLEIGPPADLAAVDAAIAALARNEFEVVAFTSANGVRGLCNRVLETGHDVRVFGRARLAAVGPRTAATLGEFHLKADLVPTGPFAGASLATALKPEVVGRRVLVARANRGREELIQQLQTVATVHAVEVYRQTDAVIDPEGEPMVALRRGEIGLVLVSSANAGRALVAAFDDTIRGRVSRGEVKLVAMSDEVARALTAAGCPSAHVAPEATSAGLIAATIHAAAI